MAGFVGDDWDYGGSSYQNVVAGLGITGFSGGVSYAQDFDEVYVPSTRGGKHQSLAGTQMAERAIANPLAMGAGGVLVAALGQAGQAAGAGAGTGQILAAGALGGAGALAMSNGNGKVSIGGVPLGGPGLAEPPANMVAKEWKIRFDSKQGDFNVQYYQLIDGRMMSYNQRTKRWHIWRPKKMVVIGKKLPSHQMLTRLRRYLKKHADDAKTILKITNPTLLSKGRFPPPSRYLSSVERKAIKGRY